jgi:hypothetical protein
MSKSFQIICATLFAAALALPTAAQEPRMPTGPLRRAVDPAGLCA